MPMEILTSPRAWILVAICLAAGIWVWTFLAAVETRPCLARDAVGGLLLYAWFLGLRPRTVLRWWRRSESSGSQNGESRSTSWESDRHRLTSGNSRGLTS